MTSPIETQPRRLPEDFDPARPRRTAWVCAILALLFALVVALHGQLPHRGGITNVFGTLLPWLWIPVLVLVVWAAARRSIVAVVAALVAAGTWFAVCAPYLLPARDLASSSNLRVISQNVQAENPDTVATVRNLAAQNADLVALQEFTPTQRTSITDTLSGYRYHYAIQTVGLWSKYPISNTRAMSLGFSWARAFRADVATPSGTVRVYVVHMASVRWNEFADRNLMLANLSAVVRADPSQRIVMMGDFNAASTDPSFQELSAAAPEARGSSFGFGFTWPAGVGLIRLDHVLLRGVQTHEVSVLPANGSDHRAVEAQLRIP
ncbi:vancomycin resistance protein VanJ [Branchiibius hedensis]|uniref:Vancomycin resistance protein VanJ n=1 Tax=Branchiibius hedensis TaxID=672460 RepID=A0A2Y8ZUJ5_9MICO|nr:endonuclease/exonuclease/phosphatase family protein [Branchiibius hedensis]PWJ26883.1 vancomycin resistance protein VanJ [Branchiibius hedensis]SSA35694.1 vancomycin resistance protein VanJ [Branchiibius hedensis]